MNTIRLEGCTTEPLGSYLKALAVLRLVAEQGDPHVRGYWGPSCFCLDTELDEEGLIEFFLKRYAPTPILSPWNGGSGFYPKDRKIGIDAIAKSTDERFAVYRAAITSAREIRGVGEEKSNSAAEEDERRRRIQLECRNRLPDRCVEWLDAAVGISAEGDRTFAPILGTGGNEGRLDYTNNFMENLAELLLDPNDRTPVVELLRNALLGTQTSGLQPGSVGQYDPGRAGGFNQGQGVETADFPSNPWNFVLTLEGGVSWAAGLYRRQGVGYRSFLCSPFTVRPTPIGYGSASTKDRELTRAEVWVPLWERPASYREIRALLREGRATVDGRAAQNGLEFAEAACLLGVDRGITGFVRYNLLKRRGDSYVALPAGRFGVQTGRWDSDLVRELNAILEEIDGQLKSPSAEIESLRRQVDEAMFNLLLRGDPGALEEVAASVGRLYRRILMTGREVWIRSRLSLDWVARLTEGGDAVEARIAAALAGIWHPVAGSIREQLDRTQKRFAWGGQDVAERMARTLERRVLIVEQEGLEENPLGSAFRADVQDVTRFLEGSVNDNRIEDLLFALVLVDWRHAASLRRPASHGGGVWPVYGLLKHVYLADQLEVDGRKRSLPGDLEVLSALMTGDVRRAVRQASRRLQNAGLVRAEIDDASGFEGMRLAAALLIPVRYGRELRELFEMEREEERQ